MTTYKLIPAALALALLSLPALAATNNKSPADRCLFLEQQFDQQITKHATAPKVARAKALRSEGAKMCQSGNHALGIRKLEAALKDIGVKPVL